MGAVGEGGVGLGRGAGGGAGAVERHSKEAPGCAGSEPVKVKEGSLLGGARRAGVDGGLGGGGVDGEGAARGALVGVAGRRWRGLRSCGGRRRGRCRTSAWCRGPSPGAVELAFEGGARLPPGSEPEKVAEGSLLGGARRAGVDGGVGGGGVDGEGAARGAVVGVAGLVGRADFEAVGAVGEVGVGLRRGAGGAAGAVELAFEGGARLPPGSSREGEGGVVVGWGPTGRSGWWCGGGGVDGEGAAGGALVGVAGLVDRPDLEAVEAVGEVGVGLGRGAGGEAGAIQSWHSKEATPLPPGSEPEKVKEGSLLEVGPAGPVRMVVSGAAVSTVKARLAGLWSVLPAWSIARTFVEAVGEVGVGLGRGAGGEAGAVELAFEGGDAAAAGVRAREGEGGVVVGGGARRAGEDGGLGGGGVDGEGAAGGGSGRCCRPGRSPGPRSCGGRRRGRCRPWPRCRGRSRSHRAGIRRRRRRCRRGQSPRRWKEVVAGGGARRQVRMVVSGAAVSTVKARLAGLWSVLPAWSIARTSKLWRPSARSV